MKYEAKKMMSIIYLETLNNEWGQIDPKGNRRVKERRLKYKPAYAINTHNFQKCSCLYRDFSLVMEIWFKVLEIHRSKCVRTLIQI